MRRRISIWAGLALLGARVCGAGEPAFLVSSDFDSAQSTTRGIQEAMDALPPGGGMVRVPQGEFRMERTLIMPPGTQLVGAGRNTVLKKAPLFVAELAEDVKRGSDLEYVVAKDTSGLRPGLAVHVADTKAFVRASYSKPWLIDRIEGNKVFLVSHYHNWTKDNALLEFKFKAKADVLVSRGAALLNAFWVIDPGVDCLIENLSVDGNAEGQAIDGKGVYRDYAGAWGILRNIKGVGRRCTVRRSWIHDAAGVNVSCSGGRALITDCEIWGGYQGVHPGAGPLVKIVNNIIHDHEHSGIYMCMGNYGCIISQNHIYGNTYGIYGLGCRIYTESPAYKHQAHLARDGDHYHIISNNQIFNNRRAGIGSQQGRLGPTDYVITGNIVRNNNREGAWRIRKDDLPAGIALYSPRNCVIANNRCYDDQDEFGCGELVKDAEAGSRELTIKYCVAKPVNVPVWAEPPYWQKFRLRLHNGTRGEEVNVIERENLPGDKEVRLVLDAPLRFSYPKDTVPCILKSQQWGMVITGPEAEGNVVMGNQCSENMVGGLLCHNPNGSVVGNVGSVVEVDAGKTFLQNLYPAVNDIHLKNSNFEGDGGWTLTKGAKIVREDCPGGKQCLRVTIENPTHYHDGQSEEIELKPQTRYRLSGWVKVAESYVDKRGRLRRPELALVSSTGKTYAMPTLGGTNGLYCTPEKLTPDRWIRYEGVLHTGDEPGTGRILCRIAYCTATAWFDEIRLEELKTYPARDFREQGEAAVLRVPPADGEGPSYAVVKGLRIKDREGELADVTLRVGRTSGALWVRFDKVLAPGEQAGGNQFYVVLSPSERGPFHVQVKLSDQGVSRQENQHDVFGEWYTAGWGGASGFQAPTGGVRAEIAIPFDTLGVTAPVAEERWRAEFGYLSRCGGVSQLASWNGSTDWHSVATYGTLVF